MEVEEDAPLKITDLIIADMKLRLLTITLALASAICAAAAPKSQTVSGEYTYYDNGHHSRNECMRIAAEQARIDALARAFGTTLTQTSEETSRIRSGNETNDFLMLSMAEVKGEWLGDSEMPKYEYGYDKDQNLIVTCRVKGTARPVSNESVAFETSVLRNGLHAKNADTRFRDGDDMYLYFLGSDNGYLTVWLEDESGTVFGLLPYPRDPKGEVKVKRYQEYTFFKNTPDQEFGPAEELILTASSDLEYNRVYVVFSPNPYSKPVMTADGGLPTLSHEEFAKWLIKSRRNDPRLGVKAINIEISPK